MTFRHAVEQARERRTLLERAEGLRATFDPDHDRAMVGAFMQLDAAIEVAGERVPDGDDQRAALTLLADLVDLLESDRRPVRRRANVASAVRA